ncbi:ribosomal L1 domain-containing protein 1 [Numida meleagris]|uniref:ribosomal L1 domain-containing protein 1 n=1 Tax=Numida meleagris TaxID=8996 RepID=UPI000B3D95CD|nr:ribosomal L1 domain-containing protein 1 [Numida meleagris]
MKTANKQHTTNTGSPSSSGTDTTHTHQPTSRRKVTACGRGGQATVVPRKAAVRRRGRRTCAGGAMAKGQQKLRRGQVRKAVEALLAFARSKAKGDALLLNENESVHLLVTVWKIPRVAQVIKIPLPHGVRAETAEVCLFTKDEPDLSAEQTESLYRKLLTQNGITSVSQVISYKTLKKEYKPFEAKRRLLNRFDLFLSDDRIRRLLPSHLGKHFYEKKKAPLSVNLKAKNLAKELQKHIQGTVLRVTNKGCCYTMCIGHTGMKADEILDNIIAAAEVIAKKLPKSWKNVKVLHLKTLKSVALPIFTARISNLDELDKEPNVNKKEGEKEKKKKSKKAAKKVNSSQNTTRTENKAAAAAATQELVTKEKVVQEPEEHADDEEIPQLVPMQITELKKVEPSRSPEKGDNLGNKTKATLGKRKKQFLAPETSKIKQEVTEEQADLQMSPKQKKPMHLIMAKEAIKELEKTPKKPEAKSFATHKAGKVVQSSKKSSKTPKQTAKKVRRPQSS